MEPPLFNGVNFTTAVVQSIEKYTEHETIKLNCAFLYRGIDLKGAVERQLYIECINSKPLQAYFSQLSAKAAVKKPKFTYVEASIARYFDNPKKEIFEINWVDHPIIQYCRWVFRSIRSILGNGFRGSNNPLPPNKILLNVGHLKFVQFLTPLTEELEGYCFISLKNSSLKKYFLKNNISFYQLNSMKFRSWKKFFHINSVQLQFTSLVDVVEILLSNLEKSKPRCVVNIEGNAPTDSLFLSTCKYFKIPCYCIQFGWSPIIHNGFRNMEYDKYFSWGPYFTKEILKFNPRQPILEAGHPTLSTMTASPPQTGILKVGFFLQAPCALISEDSYNQLLECVEICALMLPDAHIVVREHPNYPLLDSQRSKLNLQNIYYSNPNSESLNSILPKINLAVSIFSTTLIEAIALNIPALVCNFELGEAYELIEKFPNLFLQAKNIEQFKSIINEIKISKNFLTELKSSSKNHRHLLFNDIDSVKFITANIS